MDIKYEVRNRNRWEKASFTIEASFLIPVILFIILYVLQIGINFLEESITENPYDKSQEFQAVEYFYTMQRWKNFMEDK